MISRLLPFYVCQIEQLNILYRARRLERLNLSIKYRANTVMVSIGSVKLVSSTEIISILTTRLTHLISATLPTQSLGLRECSSII